MLEYSFTLVVLVLVLNMYFYLAKKNNIIDRPNSRSSHTVITIRGGGIIFFIATLIWAGITGVLDTPFILGLCLISLISFLDDLLTLSNKIRISVHIFSVLLILYQLGFSEFSIILWPLVLVLIIGWINAANFMDGINGMTVLYALTVLASCYMINIETAYIEESLLEYIVLGLLVFGYYNVRKKAKVFAGDVGSVSIGFILAFIITSLILKTQNWQYTLLLSVYGVETVVTICQRLLKRENIFKAHRTHLYQYLANELGYGHVIVSLGYAITQLILNIILVFIIIPENNSLWGVGYLLVQGVIYIGTKRKVLRRIK